MESDPKAAILINRSANRGKALKNWNMIREEVLLLLPLNSTIITYDPPFDLKNCVIDLIQNQSIEFIISAGGDGSMNYLINAIMALPEDIRQNLIIGAIGLGSSNDALKPFNTLIQGIPVKLDAQRSSIIDLGKIIIKSPEKEKRFFLNNSSIGITATANFYFNQKKGFIRVANSIGTNLSVIAAAIKAIILLKNKPIQFIYDSREETLNISNLSILKSPFLGGSLKYDQAIERDDGNLGLNICNDMSKFELVRTLYYLNKTKFTGRPKCITKEIKKLSIQSDQELPIEFDGELISAKELEYSVVPKAIRYIVN